MPHVRAVSLREKTDAESRPFFGVSRETCTETQALLAAKSGADFIAPYVSHIDNLSLDGPTEACAMASLLRSHDLDAQILAASFRTAAQVERCIAGGVTSVTLTAEMLDVLASHPGTDKELGSFRKNWSDKFGRGIRELL